MTPRDTLHSEPKRPPKKAFETIHGGTDAIKCTTAGGPHGTPHADNPSQSRAWQSLGNYTPNMGRSRIMDYMSAGVGHVISLNADPFHLGLRARAATSALDVINDRLFARRKSEPTLGCISFQHLLILTSEDEHTGFLFIWSRFFARVLSTPDFSR